jgi:hypothetical protein
MWKEKYITKNLVVYFGSCEFRFGLTLGTQNSIYLGCLCLGVDKL